MTVMKGIFKKQKPKIIFYRNYKNLDKNWGETFYSLLVTFYSLLVTFYSLLVTRYFLLVTQCFLVVTRYSLLFTRYSLLVTFYSLLITFCPLLFNKVASGLQLYLKRDPGQKQPSRGVLRKSCSENMQQIYRRTHMPKCDFALRHAYSPIKLAAYFQNTFSQEHLWRATSVWHKCFSVNFAKFLWTSFL